MAGMFKGLGKAQSTRRGNYLTPGVYHRLDVKSLTAKASQKKGGDGPFVIAEFVVRSFAPSGETMMDLRPAKGGGNEIIEIPAPVHKPGDELADVINFRHLSALGNLKGLMAGLLPGCDAELEEKALALATEKKITYDDALDLVWEELAEEITAPSNPLAGVPVKCVAVQGTTSEGNPFTFRNYEPFVGEGE